MAKSRKSSTRKARGSSRKGAARSRFTGRSSSGRSAPRRTAKRVSNRSARAGSGQTLRIVLEQAPAAATVSDAPTAIAQALANIAAGNSQTPKGQKAKF